MSIFSYEIINPPTDRKKPFLDERGFFIIPNIRKRYCYYIECARNNTNTLCREYFILLSTVKFNESCRKCRVDDYGRLKLKLHGELNDYVVREMPSRGNIKFEYLESENEYDIYLIE